MATHMITGSDTPASARSLSDIVLNIANVKGAVAVALEKVEHDECEAAGALTLAIAEMERIQQDLERIQGLGRAGLEELGAPKSPPRSAESAETSSVPDAHGNPPTESLSERIEDQREEIFGAMAIIAICIESLDVTAEDNQRRVLNQAHDRLDAAALELSAISSAVERREVANG